MSGGGPILVDASDPSPTPFVLRETAHTSRILGSLFLLIAVILMTCTGTTLGTAPDLRAIVVVLIGVIYVVPGVLFWIFGHFVQRRKDWAAVVLIMLASFSLISSLFLMALAGIELVGLNRFRGPVAPCFGLMVAIAIGVAIFIFSIKLIGDSNSSFKAIRTIGRRSTAHMRGFEPLMPMPPKPFAGESYPPPAAGGSPSTPDEAKQPPQ
jgi:hypothetical protein